MRCSRVGAVVGAVFALATACGKDESEEPGSTAIDGGRGGVAGTGGDAPAGTTAVAGGGAGAGGEGAVGGGGASPSDCESQTATPFEGRVGEVVSLELPNGSPPPYADDPTSRLIARLFLDREGKWKLICRAAGEVRLRRNGDCFGQELIVSCVDERDCCPIDADDSATGCVQFGGSPPCYGGCACTGDPNVHESITEDQNGCLMRSLASRGDGEIIPCTTPDGEVETDPREPVVEAATCERRPLRDDLPLGSCQGMAAALEAAGSVPLGAGGAAGDGGSGGEAGDPDGPEQCESDGVWRIDFPVPCYPDGGCNNSHLPHHGIELEAPTELVPDASGCDLTYVVEEPWDSDSECGIAGNRIDLHVDGDAATGFIRTAESGYCNGEATSFARATRVR